MSERLIDSYLKGVELRRAVCNWPEDVKAIADGYRTHTTISHAAQNDVNQKDGTKRKSSKRGR